MIHDVVAELARQARRVTDEASVAKVADAAPVPSPFVSVLHKLSVERGRSQAGRLLSLSFSFAYSSTVFVERGRRQEGHLLKLSYSLAVSINCVREARTQPGGPPDQCLCCNCVCSVLCSLAMAENYNVFATDSPT